MGDTATKTRAGLYLRISKDAEETGLGVKRQHDDCRALANNLGWDIVEVYTENDTSASNGKPRPVYQRMCRDVEAGRLDAVVVWDVDRLTRTPRELEDVIDFADRMGLTLANVGGDIDLTTPQGRLTARIKGSVARHEVEQSSRRLRRKHLELAEQGSHIGRRPFGWDFGPDRRLVINPAEAAIVRECARRVLSGESLWRIRNDITARGVTTTTGGKWQTQTLRRMLLRWRNCGVRTHRGREVGPGQWDAILDRETHERVVATLTDPGRRTNNRGTAVRYLLTSIALCGECSGYVVGTASHTYTVKGYKRRGQAEAPLKTRVYPTSYKCPHAGCMKVSRSMDDVDAVVEGIVIGVLQRDGVTVLGGDPDAAADARKRIEALEAKLDLAADRWADDQITDAQLARITDRVRPQLATERARLNAALPADEVLRGFAGDGAQAAWEAADVELKRRVLKTLVSAIGLRITLERIGPGRGAVFDPDSVQVTWRGS